MFFWDDPFNCADSDVRGRTALHLAAQFEHPEMAQLLLEAKADLEAQDHRGRTRRRGSDDRTIGWSGQRQGAHALSVVGFPVDRVGPFGRRPFSKLRPQILPILEGVR